MIINSYLYAVLGELADPFGENVELLLHADGANGSTSFLDSSSRNRGVATTGSNALTDAQAKFGGASVSFPGGSSYLTTPSDAGLEMFGGDFTMEGWFYFTSTGNATKVFSKRKWPMTAPSQGFTLIYYSGGWILQVSGPNAQFSESYLGNAPGPSLNAWHHVALTRAGDSVRLFVDGTQVGLTGTINTGDFAEATGEPFAIGGPLENNALLTGFVDEVRLTKGIARYVANFTAPTEPFPNPGDLVEPDPVLTPILLHFDGANGQTTTVDNSGSGQVVTMDGFTLTTAAKRFGTAAATNSESSSLGIMITPSEAMQLRGQDFTIECWARLASYGGGNCLWQFNVFSGQVNETISCFVYSSGVAFECGTKSSSGIVPASFPLNVFNHVAMSRDGDSVRLFINGVQVPPTLTNPGTLPTQNRMVVGRNLRNGSSAQAWIGQIDEFRVTKGEALYTADFTPPDAPFPGVDLPPDPTDPDFASVVMLMHMDGANGSTTFVEQKGKTVSVFGAAQVSTAQSKFGGASLVAAAGATDYVRLPSSSDFAYPGQFTIEGWVRFDTTGDQMFYGQSGSPNLYMRISAGQFQMQLMGIILGMPVNEFVAPDTWYHIAVTRDTDSKCRFFVDGVLKSSQVNSTAMGASAPSLGSGVDISFGAGLDGYMDEWRITKGVARYVANFTPPAAAFPNA